MCLDLVSISGSKESWMDAFGGAKQRWESIIVGDLPTFTSVSLLAGIEVGTGFPSTIDDVYICGREQESRDGPGGILASGGPTFVRGSEVINPRTGGEYLTTVAGRMKFDTVDIVRLQENGKLEKVILHEMAHVLGFGTLWEQNGLYNKGSGRYANDTRADAEWKTIGCSGPLPVELDHGDGTKDGHWDEDCLVSELLTGKTNLTESSSPLSRVTVGCMEDLGYVVDYSQADDISIGNLGVCGSSCPEAGTRRLRKGRSQGKLSSNEIEFIMGYVRNELAQLHQELDAAEILQGNRDDGIVFIDALNVLYEDKAGQLHDFSFTWDEVRGLNI
jgi:hypothetical protein